MKLRHKMERIELMNDFVGLSLDDFVSKYDFYVTPGLVTGIKIKERNDEMVIMDSAGGLHHISLRQFDFGLAKYEEKKRWYNNFKDSEIQRELYVRWLDDDGEV